MTQYSQEQLKTIKEKICAMIIGGALGDALGAPHEFRYQKKNYDGILDKPLVLQNRWMGPRTSALGQITDDTEMTLCLWRSIINNGYYDDNQTVLNYLEWANTPGTWAMGRNTRSLFHGVKTKKGYLSRYETVCMPENMSSQSNGSLMRCSPIAILGIIGQDWRSASEQNCSLSNPNELNKTVNKIYIKALISALKGKSKKFINRTSYELAERSNIREIRVRISMLSVASPIVIKQKIAEQETKGWCLTALTAALWGLFRFNDYKSAIDAIIKCGGDTDTNAAIAGCLLGAFYGRGIYENPITKNNIKTLLKCDTQVGDLKRPPEYQFNKLQYDMLCENINRLIDDNLQNI